MYNTIEDKSSLLNLMFVPEFAETEYNAIDRYIIVNNYKLKGIKRMVRLFNHQFANHLFKLTAKKYYLLYGQCISNRDFKIVNILKDIGKESIKKSIRKILHGKSFYIKDENFKPRIKETITIFFSVKDEQARHILKNVWSIKINNEINRLVPTHFKTSDFAQRKTFCEEFIRISDSHTVATTMKMAISYNPTMHLNKI